MASTRKQIGFILKVNLESDVVANDITISVPCPANTAQVMVKVD